LEFRGSGSEFRVKHPFSASGNGRWVHVQARHVERDLPVVSGLMWESRWALPPTDGTGYEPFALPPPEHWAIHWGIPLYTGPYRQMGPRSSTPRGTRPAGGFGHVTFKTRNPRARPSGTSFPCPLLRERALVSTEPCTLHRAVERWICSLQRATWNEICRRFGV